jgi:hypothetical protein
LTPIRLIGPTQREHAKAMIDAAPTGHVVTIRAPHRSLDQNSRLWASLTDIANQVEWYGRKLTPHDWKHVFTASLRKLAVVPNIEGTGFVALGLSTSGMSKGEFSELIELINAFGAERGVKWTEAVYEG